MEELFMQIESYKDLRGALEDTIQNIVCFLFIKRLHNLQERNLVLTGANKNSASRYAPIVPLIVDGIPYYYPPNQSSGRLSSVTINNDLLQEARELTANLNKAQEEAYKIKQGIFIMCMKIPFDQVKKILPGFLNDELGFNYSGEREDISNYFFKSYLTDQFNSAIKKLAYYKTLQLTS